MFSQAVRCPFCVGKVPRRSLWKRLKSFFSRKMKCPACHRHFGRGMGEQVAILWDRTVSDFEDRLVAQLKQLPVVDRAGVLVNFGMHMEDAKVASLQMLLRALHSQLEPQIAGLARGYEGHLDIRRVEKNNCACLDVDAMVEDGSHSRRRLRIARIELRGFIEVDLNLMH